MSRGWTVEGVRCQNQIPLELAALKRLWAAGKVAGVDHLSEAAPPSYSQCFAKRDTLLKHVAHFHVRVWYLV